MIPLRYNDNVPTLPSLNALSSNGTPAADSLPTTLSFKTPNMLLFVSKLFCVKPFLKPTIGKLLFISKAAAV
jgi:hypothetical protein